MTLPKDICRCYGEDCDRKLICLRYQTMKRDAPNIVRTYSLSLMDDDGSCKGFLEIENK